MREGAFVRRLKGTRSPEIACLFVLLDNFHSVNRDLRGAQLCDDAGGNLNTTLIPYPDDGANYEITT